jgi:hypothetical protein
MGRGKFKLLLAATTVVALIVLAMGCGGGSSSSSSTAGSTREDPAGEASAEFLHPKSPNNKYVKFGTEAPTAEREAASKVLEENLKAREEADFATQCATLNPATLEEVASPKEKGSAAAAACPKAVKELADPLNRTRKIRADTLGGPIAALRMKGEKAYALYHGNDKKDYLMPMEKENGVWKVGSLTTTELG